MAQHERMLQGRDKRITDPGHHRPLNSRKAHQGQSNEEKCLVGTSDTLDRYVVELKKRSRGRGLVRLHRLLDLKRSYPEKPFSQAIEDALHYGLFDLAGLERMIQLFHPLFYRPQTTTYCANAGLVLISRSGSVFVSVQALRSEIPLTV